MDDVRGALAANLAELRKEENLTQAEFAAQFNYSDKAVSKWERGDSLPDVVMLKTIADLYGLRVDDLLTDGGVAAAYAAATESGGEKQHDAYLMSKVLIAAMWVTMVWVVAVVVFLYSQFSIGKMYWMAFVWAVPVSFAVAFLFSRHWEGETTLLVRLGDYLDIGGGLPCDAAAVFADIVCACGHAVEVGYGLKQ